MWRQQHEWVRRFTRGNYAGSKGIKRGAISIEGAALDATRSRAARRGAAPEWGTARPFVPPNKTATRAPANDPDNQSLTSC